jgi:hypothetical protein
MGVDESAQQARQDEIQKRREAQAKELAYSAYVQGLVGTPGSAKLAYDRTLANALSDEGTYGQAKYKNIAELAAAKRAAAETQQTALETPAAAGRMASAAERLGKAGIGERLVSTDAQTASEKMRDLTSRYNATEQNKSQEKIAALSRAMQGSQFNRQEARDAANRLDDIYRNILRDEQAAQNELKAAQLRFAPETEIAELKGVLDAIRLTKEPAMNALKKKAGLPEAAAAPKALSVADQQALNWANSNPKDPRAAQIKQKLGM